MRLCQSVYNLAQEENMVTSTTMTIRISPEIKEQLGKLGALTKRSNSYLAGEAVSRYVARELEIMQGIMEGLEDMANGDLIPHEQAMDELDAIVEAARRRIA